VSGVPPDLSEVTQTEKITALKNRDKTIVDYGGAKDSDEISLEELRKLARLKLASNVGDSLYLLTGFLAGIYAILAVVDFFTMPEAIQLQTTAIATITSIIFFVATVSFRKKIIPSERVHWLLFATNVILQVDGIMFIVLTEDIMMSFGVAIMVIGIGCFFSSRIWAGITLAWLVSSTGIVINVADIAYDPLQYGLILLASVMFAVLVFNFRLRSAIKTEEYLKKEWLYIRKLEQAYSQIDTLDSLLPICASCKNVRDDQGYWSSVENYITEHSQTQFSHGICPDCMKVHYPDHKPLK